MKTLIVISLILASVSTRASEQMVLTNNSEAEALTLLLLMCPSCVVAHLNNGSSVKKSEAPKKEPDSKNKVQAPVERTLASEAKKDSK